MKKFFRQLQDRHVFKVGIAYLVMAWVVLQIADVIFPALNLPGWSITLTLALLAVGFPASLVLAWVFDIKPSGIERTLSADKASPQILNAASQPANDLSIAVLPFPDLSAEQDQQHFCDGLTEELLNVLMQISGLRVASRTSCFAFKGKETDLASAAQRLHVAHILEGSVRKSGNTLRISTQLVKASSDTRLWAATYDRELSDIFAIQDDIAERILGALKVKFSGGDLPEHTTRDPRAYEYFLRGKGFALHYSEGDLLRATELFRKAVECDPGFVRAWAALAEVNAVRALFVGGGEAARQAADDAGEMAVKLAPDRADSYLARGFGHLAGQRYAEAEREFLKAIEINPRLVRAYHYLARASLHQGQIEKTVRYFTQATDLDPDDWESPMLAIASHEKLGDQEGAQRAARIGIKRIERHMEDYPDNPRAYYLGLAGLTVLGQKEKARQWAARALELAEDRPTRYNLACFWAGEGEIETALDCLENSIQSRSWIENDPDLDELRDHPRYRALMASLPD
jgi:adenylate cyclase